MKKNILLVCFFFVFFQSCTTEPTKEKNQVQLRFIKDVAGLNPIGYNTIEARMVIDLLYQSLLTIDLKDHEIKPALAEALPKIKIQDTVSSFAYTIREEAFWPNGKPITAQDVVFTLKVANCPLVQNEKQRMNLAFIKAVSLDSSSVKKLTFLCEGYVQDMNIMTGGFPILPECKYDPEGLLRAYSLKEIKSNFENLQNDPSIQKFAKAFNTLASSHAPSDYVGSGGYRLSDWETGQFIVLKKKKDWWAASLNLPFLHAFPDKVTFQVIPDDATALLALKNSQIDVMRDIPAKAFKTLKKDNSFLKHYNLFTPFTYTVNYVGINSRLPKFASKRTRQALAHLFDLKSIIAVVGQQRSSLATSLISPYDNDNYNAAIQPYRFNFEKAKQLLTADGWRFKNKKWYKNIKAEKEILSVNLQYRAGNHEYENIALIFQQAAEKIGITVTLSPMESSVLNKNLKQHAFESYIRGLSGNPFAFNFTPILHTKSASINGMNYTGFGTKESDSLIAQIISTRNKGKQAQQIKALQDILHEEANLIFLYFDEQRIAIHNRFENLKISGLYPNYDLSAFVLKETL